MIVRLRHIQRESLYAYPAPHTIERHSLSGTPLPITDPPKDGSNMGDDQGIREGSEPANGGRGAKEEERGSSNAGCENGDGENI